VNASPSDGPSEEPLNPAAEEKIREFCYELALALRRITGRKVDQGLEELPQVIREAIENANGTEPTNQS
jgi:hypothetical protein